MKGAVDLSQERKWYGGQWKVPITHYNKHLYWPPNWIECDCGELAHNCMKESMSLSTLLSSMNVKLANEDIN